MVEFIDNLSQGALNISVMVATILIVGGLVIAIIWLLLNFRKYSEYKCVIWRLDGTEKVDQAGVFVDKKTNNKRLFLRKSKIGLNADNIPFTQGKAGFLSGGKTVYLLQTGLKNFRYIKVNPKIPEKSVSIIVGEEDVNWAINAYERQKKLFQNSLWMQLLPFITLAFVCVVILIIFIYFFREFSTLKEVAIEFKETAKILLQARSGTTIS